MMNHERLVAFRDNAEKPEHITDTFSPILATVEDAENMSPESRVKILKRINENNTTYVQYGYHSPEWLDKRDVIQNSEDNEGFWIMSKVDSKDKFSNEYKSCLGLAVVGVDHNGSMVSFLTHTNPIVFAHKKSHDEYIASLRGNLIEIKNRCQIGSIDGVTFGGRVTWETEYPGEIDPEQTLADDYKIATEVTADIVEQILSFKPLIAEGPRLRKNYEYQKFEQQAYLDTTAGHLHIIIRGAAKNSGFSFSVDTISEEFERIKPLKVEVNRNLK